jgi:hypothetical protein
MDRRIASGLAAAALLTAIAVATPPATAVQQPGPCALHRADGESVHHFSKRLIVCSVRRFGPIPGGSTRAVCIARRESGLDPKATSSPTGRYLGLFQHDRRMWPGRYDRYTDPAWELSTTALNGRSNAVVTIRMVEAIGTWKAAGWPPKSC